MMASQRVPGGMSFDPNDPTRLVFVERRGREAGIATIKLGPQPVRESFLNVVGFPANPQFTGWSKPDLVWNSVKWQRTTYHHDIQLLGRCG